MARRMHSRTPKTKVMEVNINTNKSKKSPSKGLKTQIKDKKKAK